ncbi:stabilizer of axonemal microtubules 1 isoform X1 [Spodoptera frugiperda]|uniref:Stabilizer of axonemal microtubules 1 isoform X1 n=3 Tax=Spodoptera frugiperda TaxID=7108 RepID=A0A9R0DIT4_SPOFR|nr:stabilizer of axonemal microtubules 1 isoform X1 [Spodoptera frugiperda]
MPECCIPCPAAAPCAMSAGIKSGLRDGKPIDGKQEHPCPCRTCCCGKPPIVKPCYKQPRIPDSYAPRRCYMRPTAPVESCTTYKLSYLPVDGCRNLRGEARKPPPNLVPSCEPMEGCTVQKLSYLPNPTCITQPIRPCNHDMWGQGPMQNITTQRHDYVPKPCVLRESFKPAPKFHCVEQPFENRTINKLSYLPPEKIELTKSFAPERCYERPAAKMEGTTTQKMSYMPNQILPKEPLPWACKGQYQKPCQKLDSNTTYGMSYLDAASDCRRRAIIPDSCNNPVTSSKRFETQTIYKNSYLPTKCPIPQPIKPLSNLVPSTAQMEGDTVQKLSYLPNPTCITQPIRPCHHDMWGQGPMQNITTQRHDYVPKPCAIRESCKPDHKFHCIEQPFENRTVNRMSFLDPGRCAIPTSYAPLKCYEKPAAKMESTTTQKMSYQPVCVPKPQMPPWACKGQYQKPCQKLEGTTIYRSSFLPPGEDCTEYMDPCKYGDCKPCDCICPAECITTDPCACNFPKAACCS